jgi:Ca2+-binding RTX toxin-like protein
MALNPVPGTDGDDPNLLGTDEGDRFDCLDGNDTAGALGGDDLVFGGGGDDVVFGGNGDDRIHGEGGNDSLSSGGTGVAQTDRIFGGNGEDDITFQHMNGGTADGGGGDDRIVILWGGSEGVTLDFSQAVAVCTQGAVSITIENVERLFINASAGDDTITGGDLADVISVAAGSNTVEARGGDDQVVYYIGGENVLKGGAGTDLLEANAISGTAIVFDAAAAGGVDDGHGSTIQNFEIFSVNGAELDDRIVLGDGGDSAFGGSGDDRLTGGDGNDSLLGGNDDDKLFGGKDDDTLIAGTGSDTLKGGGGSDNFQFLSAAEFGDTVLDFGTGGDRLLIASLAIGGALSGGQVPTVTEGDAVGFGGQFVFEHDAGKDLTTLRWDANGEAAGGRVVVAKLEGDIALDANDFLIFG